VSHGKIISVDLSIFNLVNLVPFQSKIKIYKYVNPNEANSIFTDRWIFLLGCATGLISL
jgi:hypothetical protein